MATCSVPGCSRSLNSHDARGMCQAHYLRWKKYGDTGGAQIKEYRPGLQCSVPDCARKAKAGGLCNSHYEQRRLTGRVGPIRKWSLTGQSRYTTAHVRIRKAKGPASAHPCVHCGVPAQQWAYDHSDPDAQSEVRSDGSCLIFSVDPDRYIPLCIRCHRAFDRSVRPAS